MEEHEKDQKKPDFDKWKVIHLGFEMGFIIALPLLAFIAAGKWLDARFGTEPWITFIGVFMAIGSTITWLTKRFKELA